jgi:predicted ATPase
VVAQGTLVGRRSELVALRRRLARAGALVTVVGAGGLGKTSLARGLMAAADDERTWRFVALESARTPADAVAAIAEALGLETGGSADTDVLERAGRVIEQQRAVVVLDNFEQLVPDAASLVSPLLDGLRRGALLVTSREPLGLAAEDVFGLEPLEVAAGIELLESAARRVRRTFRVRQQTRSVVREIVEAVDGLPLAIELCAARVPLLGLEEVLARTRRQLDLFGKGPRDRTERHRTLRACIAASWDLLEEHERAAFAQCSLFVGGFDVRAAEAVLTLPPGAPAALDVVDGLVGKSLLRLQSDDAGGAGRLMMFASLHEFARERFDELEGDLRADAGARYGRHYAAVAPRMADAAEAGDRDALAWLRRERDNLVAAHERSLEAAPDVAVSVTLALHPLLYHRGPVALHLRLLDDALASARSADDPEALVELLYRRGETRHAGARLSEAEEDLRAAIAAVEDAGEARSERMTRLGLLATAALLHTLQRSARADEAITLGEEAIAHARAAGASTALSRLLNETAGALMVVGRIDEAERDDREALAVCRADGNKLYELSVLSDLAVIHLWQGRLEEAAAVAVAALPVANELGAHVRAALLNETLALVEHARGDVDAASARFEEAMRFALASGRQPMIERIRGDRAGLDVTRGRAREAIDGFELASRRLEARGDKRMAGVMAALSVAAHALADDLASCEAALARADALLSRREVQLRRAVRGFIAAVRERRSEDPSSDARAADDALDEMERSRSTVLAKILRRQLRRARGEDTSGASLWVRSDGGGFQLPRGAYVSLERKASVHPILVALARERIDNPGGVLDIDALFVAGWPDDEALPAARKNRVHVAIAALRKAGLKGLLLTRDGGYCLDPTHAVTVGDDVGSRRS